jgi:hypothetical protein
LICVRVGVHPIRYVNVINRGMVCYLRVSHARGMSSPQRRFATMRSITPFADARVRSPAEPRSLARLLDGRESAASSAAHVLHGARDPIHGAISPADVRPGDPIFARVRVAGAPLEGAEASVWRISPLGLELVRTGPIAAAAPGDAVDVTLRLGTSVTRFPARCAGGSRARTNPSPLRRRSASPRGSRASESGCRPA